jgi:hypothetical protein
MLNYGEIEGVVVCFRKKKMHKKEGEMRERKGRGRGG